METMTADDEQLSFDDLDPGGVVRSGAPDYVRKIAGGVDAIDQRSTIRSLLERVDMTSKEISTVIREAFGEVPAARPNQIGARLGELFAADLAAPRRERGMCTFGSCRRHDPEKGYRHRPTDACAMHGKIVTRDGAAVWCWKVI